MPQMNISTSVSGFSSPGTQKGIGSFFKVIQKTQILARFILFAPHMLSLGV